MVDPTAFEDRSRFRTVLLERVEHRRWADSHEAVSEPSVIHAVHLLDLEHLSVKHLQAVEIRGENCDVIESVQHLELPR